MEYHSFWTILLAFSSFSPIVTRMIQVYHRTLVEKGISFFSEFDDVFRDFTTFSEVYHNFDIISVKGTLEVWAIGV